MSFDAFRKKKREKAIADDAKMGATYLGTSIKNAELGGTGNRPMKIPGPSSSPSSKPSTTISSAPAINTSSKTATSDVATKVRDLESYRSTLENTRKQLQTSASNTDYMSQQRKLDTVNNLISSVESQLSDLKSQRPDYDRKEAQSKYDAYEAAEVELTKKYGSVEKLLDDIDAQYADLQRRERQLKETEKKVQENPADPVLQKLYKAQYQNYQNVFDKYQALYADLNGMQTAWAAYTDYGTAANDGLKSSWNRALQAMKGAAEGQVSGNANALTTAYAKGQKQRSLQNAELLKENQAALDKAKATLKEMVASRSKNPGSIQDSEIKSQQNVVADLQRKVDALAKSDTVQAQATGAAHRLADRIQEISSRDIQLAKEGTGKLGSTLLDATVAGTQLGLDILTGRLLGIGGKTPGGNQLAQAGTAGSIAMRGFGAAAQQARQAGASVDEQVAYGLASAALEVVTEKATSVGKFNSATLGPGTLKGLEGLLEGMVAAVEKQGKTAAGRAALNRLASMGAGFISEGLEEGIATLVDPILQKIYSSETIDWGQVFKDAGYDALVGGLLGMVTSGVGGTDTSKFRAAEADMTASVDTATARNYNKPEMVSAAAPEIQQAEAQAEITRIENPKSDVLTAAQTAYLDAGIVAKIPKAKRNALIVQDLIDGKKVDNDAIDKLALSTPKAREVFTQLTGVQFPTNTKLTPELLRNLARSAHAVAQEAAVQQAQAVAQRQAEQDAVNKIKADFQAMQAEQEQSRANYQPDESTQTRIAEAQADLADQVSNIDIGPDGKPLASLADFTAAYRATLNPDATDGEIRQQYKSFREGGRTVLFAGHRLTREQFGQFLRENLQNGKNLTDQQLDALFNSAIMDTLNGDDGFDRYTKPDEERAGTRPAKTSKRDGDTMKLDNGGSITRKQFIEFMREVNAHSGKSLNDDQLSAMFDAFRAQEKMGKAFPYNPAMDKFMKEENTNGRADNGAETGDSGEVVRRRGDRSGDRERGWTGSSDDSDVRDSSGQAAGRQTHLQPRRDQRLGRLSGLKNPRTRKVRVPGVKGTVDAVWRSDYTEEMWSAHNTARELGFKLHVVTSSFEAKFSNGYSRCVGLADRKNRIFTVSAEEYGQTNFWTTFRHELIHLFGKDRKFQTEFFQRITDTVKIDGLSSQSDIVLYLQNIAETNKYLAPYRAEFKKLGLTKKDANRCLWEEMCAEFFSGNNDGLKIDQKVFDALHDAAVKAFDEVSPTYETAIKEEVLKNRQLTKGYKLAQQQDTADKESSEAIDKPDRAFSMTKEKFWDEQLDSLNEIDAENSEYDEFLSQIEKEYGAEFAGKLNDAFYNLDESKQAAVGAANYGFDPYSTLMHKYGNLEPGENPSRVFDAPAKTDDRHKVSRTPQTVAEAKATPDSRIESIEDAIVGGKVSYIPKQNKIMVRKAEQTIKKDGWAKAIRDWTVAVRNGETSAELTAMGATLLNNAGNREEVDGKTYVTLLVDYSNMLRRAGQATQAARILKNLTPEGRLYGLQGYVTKMNEQIRGSSPKNNIPVEKWMELTGENLAQRLIQSVGGNKKKAKTTAQIILSDLNAFAKTAFPAKEKEPGRTERDRLQDLFDNYENYNEAWEAAKATVRERYADQPDALAAFENWLETDLASTFMGQYFGHPEIRIRGDLADKFLAAKTEEERDGIIDEIMDDIAAQIPATWQEKFRALRYMNMLGNFKTQVRNVIGNAAMMPVRRTKDAIGAAIEGGLALAGKDVERTKSFTRDKETYKTAIDDFEAVADIIMDGGKYDDGRNYTKTIEDRRRIFRNALLEGYRKVTNDAMNNGVFGDKAFSRFAYADALSRYLTANKVTFGTATPDMLDKARAYAIKQAAEATYRDKNAFSDMISSIRFRNPDTVAKKAANIIAEGILPFRRTPANILVRAIEYNPIGVVLTAAEAAVDKKTTGSVDTTKFIDNLSKNITGLGLAYLGYLLASEGLLRGAAPDDEEKEKYDELLGRQAYSLELPSGRSITLDWLAPGSIPLFLGAQVAQAALEDGFTFRDGLEALGSITDPMLQMSMLQGVNDTLQNASSYGDDSALVRFTGNALWSFVTQGMTNTMLGQIERSLTKDRMTTYVDKNGKLPDGLQRLIGQTSAKTPGWDYSQIPYIDAWGRIDQNAETSFGNVFNQFLNPSYTSRVTVSDMEKELERLYDVTGDPGALPNRASAYFNVNKQRVDLSAEQYVEYAMGSGEYKYNLLTDLIEDPAYAELDDQMKLKTVEKIYDFSSQVMKAQVTGYGPEKWGSGEDAPEDAYTPEKWVVKAYAAPEKYGVSAAEYIRLAAQVGGVEGIPDENGDTITNSASLQKAAIVHKMDLPKEEADKLMEDLGVGKTVRGYSKKEVESKLKELLK